jgi:hypothetical protein
MHVAANAINYGPRYTALVRDRGQDVAPDSGVVAAAVIEHDNGIGLQIVDVIADGAGRCGRGPVQDREGAAGQAKARIERFDAEALAGYAEAIESVAERCCVEF